MAEFLLLMFNALKACAQSYIPGRWPDKEQVRTGNDPHDDRGVPHRLMYVDST
jgi:hypothetical protein